MVQYFLSGGVLMIPIFLSFFILVFMLFKNIKGVFHIDKIILIGSTTAIFGIIATGIGINGALSVAPDISKIAPHILWSGLKSSLVTTFSGGFILFFSTFYGISFRPDINHKYNKAISTIDSLIKFIYRFFSVYLWSSRSGVRIISFRYFKSLSR